MFHYNRQYLMQLSLFNIEQSDDEVFNTAKDLLLIFQDGKSLSWANKRLNDMREKYSLQKYSPVPSSFFAQYFGYDPVWVRQRLKVGRKRK